MSSELVSNLYANTRYLAARQKILSQNIANSDTPNYKAKDLMPFRYNSKNNFQLLVTHPSHVDDGSTSAKYRAREDKTVYESTPDGNKVSLEQQFVKVSEVQERYALANGLIRKWRTLGSYALNSSI